MVHTDRRRTRRTVACLLGVLLGVAPGTRGAEAQEANTLSEAEADLASFQGRVVMLSREFERPPEAQREYDINRALNDASVRYMLGDYTSAAIIFERLLDERGFEAHVGYPSAVFYLADSYFCLETSRAKRFYQETLDLGDREYVVEAALRLIDLATILGEFDDASQERYYEILERSGARIRPTSAGSRSTFRAATPTLSPRSAVFQLALKARTVPSISREPLTRVSATTKPRSSASMHSGSSSMRATSSTP